MDTKKGKLANSEDGTIEQAYQNYKLLKEEVDIWQQERSSYWLKMFNMAEKPPYLPVLDLPSEAIIELWQRLNQAARVEISDSKLREMWQQFKESQEIMDEKMSARFQMAVRGVAHLASQMADEKKIPAQSYHDHGSITCPVCGEDSALAVLTPPNGKRTMHCTLCGFEWEVNRVGCLHCGSENAKQQIYLKNEAFPGIEMVVCQLCGQYFKEIDTRELYVQDYIWEDIRTLPLNFATELWLSEQAKKSDQIH